MGLILTLTKHTNLPGRRRVAFQAEWHLCFVLPQPSIPTSIANTAYPSPCLFPHCLSLLLPISYAPAAYTSNCPIPPAIPPTTYHSRYLSLSLLPPILLAVFPPSAYFLCCLFILQWLPLAAFPSTAHCLLLPTTLTTYFSCYLYLSLPIVPAAYHYRCLFLPTRNGKFIIHLGYLQHPCYFGFSLKKSGFSHNYFWFV